MDMFVLGRRLVAAAIFLASLFPQWGFYDYTSSLHPNSRNHPFTGLDAVRQQSMLECLSCLGIVVLFFGWLSFRDLAARREGVATSKGWGWDFVLLGIIGACTVGWLRILSFALTHDRDRFWVSSLWYRDLLPGFWVFPVAVVLAKCVRFLPLGTSRATWQASFNTSIPPEYLTILSRAQAVLAHGVAKAVGLLVSGMLFVLCSLLYLALR
ncbi:MAG TPA: hypothetical protein VF914_04935 [Chloroflexia bacterium]|jgi:hypothetical protein